MRLVCAAGCCFCAYFYGLTYIKTKFNKTAVEAVLPGNVEDRFNSLWNYHFRQFSALFIRAFDCA
jgi:hypothetical protein